MEPRGTHAQLWACDSHMSLQPGRRGSVRRRPGLICSCGRSAHNYHYFCRSHMSFHPERHASVQGSRVELGLDSSAWHVMGSSQVLGLDRSFSKV